MSLWLSCNGIKHITSLSETAWRLVESQDTLATRKLVDSLEEQELLEELIESIKPPLNINFVKLHPLLYTPFRYPPLKYGSRFSSRFENALWYGSLAIDTVLAEKAYYQFNFLRASKADFDIVEVPLTLFSVEIKTERGIRLTGKPFKNYTQSISSPISYEESQALGASMRQAHIEAFNYQSARDVSKGINMGVFSPKAFTNTKPNSQSFQSWQCIASNSLVEFVRSSSLVQESYRFLLDTFLINGDLLFPAL